MAKKIMLWPSTRSKYVKDKNMQLIFKTLIIISIVMIISNYYMYSFMYGLKLFLMLIISYYVTRETEILFYSHDKDINRQESKQLIEKSYWRNTAILYALLIPIGTPLWLVALGAVLATLLGKLIFGGFHHMIFHSSLVGAVIVTQGWRQVPDTVGFAKSFGNDILKLIFDRPFFNETLSIGGIFDPENYVSILDMLKVNDLYEFSDLIFGIVPGVLVSGIVVIIVGGFLIYKKAINYITPVSLLLSFFATAMIIGLVKGFGPYYAFYQLFSGSLLFVTFLIATNPITSPINNYAKIIFGVVAGMFAMFIRNGSEFGEGIIISVLFMQMLTPMLNTWFSPKKAVKKPVKKAGV